MQTLWTFSAHTLLALVLFVTVTSITPGPNNLMLLHGGIRAGFNACRLHMLGISLGCGLMVWLSYIGLAELVMRHPFIFLGLKVVGSVYLSWLTYVLWRDGVLPPPANELSQKTWRLPLSFWQAVWFQFLNPKAWAMVLMVPSIAMLTGTHVWFASLAVVAVFVIINLLCISVWAYGGQALQGLWRRPQLLRAVHAAVVLMAAYCVVAIWLPSAG